MRDSLHLLSDLVFQKKTVQIEKKTVKHDQAKDCHVTSVLSRLNAAVGQVKSESRAKMLQLYWSISVLNANSAALFCPVICQLSVSILSCNIEQILQLLNFALHIRLQTLSKFLSFISLSIHFWDQKLTYNMGLAWGWYDWQQIPFTTTLVPLKHRIEFSKHWTISFFGSELLGCRNGRIALQSAN